MANLLAQIDHAQSNLYSGDVTFQLLTMPTRDARLPTDVLELGVTTIRHQMRFLTLCNYSTQENTKMPTCFWTLKIGDKAFARGIRAAEEEARSSVFPSQI